MPPGAIGSGREPGSPRCCQPRPPKPSCGHNGYKPDSGPTNPHGKESGAESRRAASRALRLPQPAAHPPASLGGCRQRGTTATRPPRPAARPAGIPCSSPPARCVQTPAAPPRSLPPRTRTGSRGGPASISAVPMATASRWEGSSSARRICLLGFLRSSLSRRPLLAPALSPGAALLAFGPGSGWRKAKL